MSIIQKGARKIAPLENCPPVRFRVWFTIRVRIRAGGQFSSGAIFLELFKRTTIFLIKLLILRVGLYRDLGGKSLYSVRKCENTDQKKLRIWILFTQFMHDIVIPSAIISC